MSSEERTSTPAMTRPESGVPFEFAQERQVTIEEMLRLIAGTFVILSLALGYFVNPAWYLFTAFVGLNLFQSALTGWCPMMWILRKAGLGASRHP